MLCSTLVHSSDPHHSAEASPPADRKLGLQILDLHVIPGTFKSGDLTDGARVRTP